jgi:hypothetical protein
MAWYRHEELDTVVEQPDTARAMLAAGGWLPTDPPPPPPPPDDESAAAPEVAADEADEAPAAEAKSPKPRTAKES